MGKRLWVLVMASCFVVGFSYVAHAGDTTVGGHLKITMFDFADGDHTTGGTTVSSDENVGFSFREMILYFSQEIDETLSVDLQPMWSTSTGATPKFGKDIGEQKQAAGNIEEGFHGWIKAVVKKVLPYEIEASVGIVKPRFTWDYGAELFWEDEYNGGKFSANNYLGAMHDTGFEVYRPFELGAVSLPAYVYFLNGGYEFADNNRNVSTMLRLEPEMGPLKISGSFLKGKYDDAGLYYMTRWSGGLAYEYGPFNIRGEFAGGNWEKSISGTKDAKPSGYYVKAFYKVFPWMQCMIHYDYVDHNFTGFFYTAPGSEEYVTITPEIRFSLGESTFVYFQYDIADWTKRNSAGIKTDEIEFKRLTVALRTTF